MNTKAKVIGNKTKVEKGLTKEFLINNEWSNSFANNVENNMVLIEETIKTRTSDLLQYVEEVCERNATSAESAAIMTTLKIEIIVRLVESINKVINEN